jgi:tetratricopeptide (TPR) repeat protein
MTDALITELGKISTIGVTGRRSVTRFKHSDVPLEEIARVLNVDAFVLGSTVSSDTRVRIAVQLARPHGGTLMWSENYERDIADIVALQGEVARAISREIRAGLASDKADRIADSPQVKPEAIKAYLMGLSLRAKMEHSKGIEYFEQAIDIDPSFAEAYASLANDLLYEAARYGVDTQGEAVERARGLVKTALDLDPNLSEAYRALGRIRKTEWDWAGVLDACQHAVDLNPNNVHARILLGLYLIYDGNFEDGINHCEQAQRLDPLSFDVNVWLAFAYGMANRWEMSLRQLEFVQELNPSWEHIHHCRGAAYASLRRWDDAVASCDRWDGFESTEYCGPIYAKVGQRQKAHERLVLCTSGEEVYPLCAASIHSALGEIDEAINWIEEAFERKDMNLYAMMSMPLLFDNLRDDPRFLAIKRKMGLPANKR